MSIFFLKNFKKSKQANPKAIPIAIPPKDNEKSF